MAVFLWQFVVHRMCRAEALARSCFFLAAFTLAIAEAACAASTRDADYSGIDAAAPDGSGGDTGTTGDDGGATGNDAQGPAPSPILDAVSPARVLVGATGPTLIVTGSAFVGRSVVQVDGSDLLTTFVGDAELRAPLPSSRLNAAATLHITVFTSAPGGGTSGEFSFAVENPFPVLTGLSPPSAPAGSLDTPLTATGSGFATDAKMTFGTLDLAVTASSATSITAIIPAAQLAAGGSQYVTISNPAPGGGTSTSIAFTVTNPNITITSVIPPLATAGDPQQSVSVVGTGFVLSSTVDFNGTPLATTYVDATHLNAQIPASLLLVAGTFPVSVTSPPPGGGTSAPVTFQVKNPTPVLASLSPNTGFYHGPDATVLVNGSGFLATTVVRAGGTSLSTTYMTPNQLSVLMPATLFLSLGTFQVDLLNPAPGGGVSASSQTFYVVCDPTGVDIGLGSIGNVVTIATSFALQPAAKRIRSQACPTGLDGTLEPVRAIVAQNTIGISVTLSAWAVCSSSATAPIHQDDALLAFYRRSAAPQNDAERQACASGSVVSEGELGGAGDFRSPESGGSRWCPGLTKASGTGLVLNVCEKAVVYITPYDVNSTSFTPPPQLRVKAE